MENIGANDVANSMASAVGAKAITIRQAVYSKRLWKKNRPLIHGLPCWLQSFLQLFWTMQEWSCYIVLFPWISAAAPKRFFAKYKSEHPVTWRWPREQMRLPMPSAPSQFFIF
jgi:hypothetical protein